MSAVSFQPRTNTTAIEPGVEERNRGRTLSYKGTECINGVEEVGGEGQGVAFETKGGNDNLKEYKMRLETLCMWKRRGEIKRRTRW